MAVIEMPSSPAIRLISKQRAGAKHTRQSWRGVLAHGTHLGIDTGWEGMGNAVYVADSASRRDSLIHETLTKAA